MIVTLAPKRACIEANSTPTAPEPITTSDFGTSASSSIPVEESTVFSSMSIPGRDRGVDPVATMTFLPVSTVSAPSAPVTDTRPAPARRPKPAATSTRFFFIRKETPLVDWRTIFSLCFRAAGMSRRTSRVATPTSAPWRASSRRSAVCRSALVGMHPQSVQTPPSRGSFSTMRTDSPSCAARIAATYPPGPEPMMMRS